MQHRLADALAAFGLRGGVATFVRHGENTTYRVDHDGRAYALRVHRPGYQTPASVRSEIAWMEALADAGLATPAALRSTAGRVVEQVETGEGRRLVAVFTWIEGEPLARHDTPALWRELGAIMATVHVQARGWQLPTGFVRHAWDAEGMVGTGRPLWGDPVALGRFGADERHAIEAARTTVRRRLANLPTTPDVYSLVHGDLAFENVLVRPDGAPAVIDFDDCGWGWRTWELAVALFPWDGEDGFADRRDALVAGYREVSPLPDAELGELPTFVMARRIATLGWLFTHEGTAHADAQRPWRLRTLGPAIARYLAWAGAP